jgi:hypothetical protein
MEHWFNNIIFPVLYSFFLFHITFILGKKILQIIKWDTSSISLRLVATSVLVGYGLLSYITLFVSAFGPLYKSIILLILLLFLSLGYRSIYQLYKHYIFKLSLKNWTGEEKILLVGAMLFGLFYFISALVPPYRTDALAYHLPEAMSIANHGMHFPVNGGRFFGNLPLLVETLYALLYRVHGFTLIHLSHYQIILAGLVVWFSFLKKYFGRKTGLIGVILVFTLYELFVDATNAYVDAAEIAFEITGLYLLVEWVCTKNRNLLPTTGLLFGFALSTKYNAFYGVGIAGLMFLLVLFKQKISVKEKFTSIFYFCLPLFLACGFWYIKNTVLFHNPIYPFYLGHPGFSNAEYLDLVETIKLFEMDRTLGNFLLFPAYFFLKNAYYLLVFVAFITMPLAFLKRKNSDQNNFFIIGVGYIIIYSMLWFFSATHQLKFFFGPMVMALCILAVHLDFFYCTIIKHVNKKVVLIIACSTALILVYAIVRKKDNYFLEVKKTELCYIQGSCTKEEFYTRKNLGGAYALSRYINKNYTNTKFFNVWSTPDFFLENGNMFIGAQDLYFRDISINSSTIKNFLNAHGAQYIVIDKYEKSQAFTEPVRVNNPAYVSYRDVATKIDELIPIIGELVKEQNNVSLFKLR